ncbi:MAG: tyrosine-type recombinase/integrase [Terriglobales bacterium]
MTVTVYARHGAKCPKSRERNTGQYKRCKCPLWLRWGKHDKKSARTRSWDIATKAARKLEQELELAANGIEPPKKPDHITIESAADLYLGDMAQRGIKDLSKARRMLSRLQDYANGKNVILLKDVTARLLTEWRSGWTFKKESDSPAVHWSVVKTFFKWAFATDLIAADPSAKLKSLPSGRHQVLPLSRDEFDRILTAVDQCGFKPEITYRVKCFILLQRWSGLACMDAATLSRLALSEDSNISRERNKTDNGVFVPIPDRVAEMLRMLPSDHPEYFFWNPDRMKKTSIVAMFGDWLRTVFDKAGVAHSTSEMLSHRFRHTFAVELLLAGVGIERVSKLLGHKTVRTTEKYYSAWVKERQQKLVIEVKDAWKHMQLPTATFPVKDEVQ